MNERIKELIKQAADQTSAAFSSSNFRQSEWESDFREKFAELIVRECIAQCNDGDSQYFIAKHFGVEDPKTYLKQGYEE